MPEKWTGRVVGRMHVEQISTADLAREMGVTRAYVSMLLNCSKKPEGARERVEGALEAIIEKRRHNAEKEES